MKKEWKVMNWKLKRKDEIKKCQIEINNELIQFYFHKFKSKGKYLIKYIFNNIITKTCYMFYHCSSLKLILIYLILILIMLLIWELCFIIVLY